MTKTPKTPPSAYHCLMCNKFFQNRITFLNHGCFEMMPMFPNVPQEIMEEANKKLLLSENEETKSEGL
ncbi:MAG: hypothetical protein KKC77_19445, partial [Proteobacteria bacterium]|nr:hypothetical protein [Pseudomonadota bacterium]